MPASRFAGMLFAAFLLALAIPSASEETAGFQGSVQLQPTKESFLHVGDENDPCEPISGSGTTADPYVFEAFLDHFTSHTGNFAFKGCGPAAQPVLKITAGACSFICTLLKALCTFERGGLFVCGHCYCMSSMRIWRSWCGALIFEPILQARPTSSSRNTSQTGCIPWASGITQMGCMAA
jgi:hypothetical protein